MIKALGTILLILGAIGLIFGIIGLFGQNFIAINPWALTILGVLFFFVGSSMLKRRRDTDEIRD